MIESEMSGADQNLRSVISYYCHMVKFECARLQMCAEQMHSIKYYSTRRDGTSLQANKRLMMST